MNTIINNNSVMDGKERSISCYKPTTNQLLASSIIFMAPTTMLIFRALLLLILISINSGLCFSKNLNSTEQVCCRDEDREALLKIKVSLSDPLNLLKSWENEGDCCKWKGVSCGAATGHVIKLELLPHMPITSPYALFRRYTTGLPEPSLSAYELSPHLVELKYLNHLDLTGIRLIVNATSTSKSIPNFIGSMKQLRYLNLSGLYFHGSIPHVLGNLTDLEVLDLRQISGSSVNIQELLPNIPVLLPGSMGQSVRLGDRLFVDDSAWVSSLVALKYIDISGVNLTAARNVLQVLSMLPCLSHLAVRGCLLDRAQLSHDGRGLFNSTSFFARLQYLDLSGNWIGGEVPSALGNMTALKYLDLSLNRFNSSVPIWFDSFESLVHLHLGSNDFDKIEGGLSHFVRGKCNLSYLNLDYIKVEIGGNYSTTTTGFCGASKLEILHAQGTGFKGDLFDWLGNLKNLRILVLTEISFSCPTPYQILGTLTNLMELDLSRNGLKGEILQFLNLSRLRVLDIGHNNLQGTISEAHFANMWQLSYLDISNNQLQGNISEVHFANLSQLSYLDISKNQLEGTISEVYFANLSRLRYLDMSNNKLSIELQSGWVPPFQLFEIRMSSCNFGAQFPNWIQTQTEARKLYLSNANISGDITEMLGTSAQWQELDLSHNSVHGTIQNLPPSITYLEMSHNLISSIMIGNVSYSNMQILDISHNQVSGVIPLDFTENLPSLQYLLLNDNHFSGSIPTTLCYSESLEALDLSANHFSGTIPESWGHSSNGWFIDLSSNKLSGTIPISLGNQTKLSSLHLNNNSLHGEIPYSLSYLQHLTFLDLGENNLSGNVPAWIGQNLKFLQALGLRGNHLTGDIPLELCSLSGLKILDLGGNDLGGHIPHCLGHISRMAILIAEPSDSDSGLDKMVMIIKGLKLKYTTNLKFVVAMDLSSNNFVGSIPKDLTLLVGLQSLNLSHNFLSGNIPEKIGDLKNLESLDLSNNHLSGSIPASMSTLTFLSHLNFSNNGLQGRVPKSNQLDTLDDSEHSIYAGNPLLCGEQLSKKCPGDHEEPVPSPREEKEDHDGVSEKQLLYIGVVLGFVAGFWGVVVTLLLNRTLRAAYFDLAEGAIWSVYVAVKVKVNKIKRRMGCA